VQPLSGSVVWFTGLSGAGKSTICEELAKQLRLRMHQVWIIDGDEIRKHLSSDLGYTIEDRTENIRRITCLAQILSQCGIIVLVAAISPLRSMRELVRSTIPGVLEVFVDAPLDVCESRDPKGLYKKARLGNLSHFTGLSSPFESPTSPDVTCRTHLESVEESCAKVLEAIQTRVEKNAPQADPQRARRPTIAVDLDGVIANYDGWRGASVIGPPRPDVVKALALLKSEGWKIVIHTTRSAEAITGYLTNAQVPYDEINENSDYATSSPKPVATVYWDDRAVRYSGDALRDLALIRTIRTWNGRA